MDIFTKAIWLITAIFLIFSIRKDKSKTIESLKKAFGMGRGLMPSIITVILAISLLLAIIPPDKIATFVEGQNVFVATIVSALFGTITLIPAFIAFPLVGTLVDAGVGIVAAVSFLTTLTMVGVVTYPIEKESFGKKFAITRNALSFVFAIFIALAMGGIL